MNLLECATGTLAPYVPSEERPWNRERVQHLYRRMGFGIAAKNIAAALEESPTALVNRMIDEAINLPLPEAPYWANYTRSDYEGNEDYIEQSNAWIMQWGRDMFQHGFREKLALFWHNHFVTELDAYVCPSWQYAYHKLLQEYALGDFKTFLIEMGKTPAMLVYLNGVQNTRLEPNENYARELFELFTLGRDNGYTQQDIEETARALTGWNDLEEVCAPVFFRPFTHDSGEKTILGRTGNWNYMDVHTILFEERADEIAELICTKFYKQFVAPQVEESILVGMKETFKTNNFNIAPVLRQLFQSEHFFDAANIGVVIKSPIEHMLMIATEWGVEELSDEFVRFIFYTSSVLGQRIFNPVDVAGWQGDRTWIDSSKLPARWQHAEGILGAVYQQQPELLLGIALSLVGNSNDPYAVSRAIVDYLIPNGFQNEDTYERAAIVFKSEIPENYYEDGSWNLYWEEAPTQVGLLIRYLIRQPDFQLA